MKTIKCDKCGKILRLELCAVSRKSESAGSVLSVALGHDSQWPTTLLLDKLCEAADLLLHHCDYDGDGWEKIQYAMNEGKKRSEQIKESLKQND